MEKEERSRYQRYQRCNSEQMESDAKIFIAIRKRHELEHEKIEKISKMFVQTPKPNVNAQDGNDMMNTPLHMAARRGYLEVVKFLLNQGADSSIQNNENKTPLELAKELENNFDIIDALNHPRLKNENDSENSISKDIQTDKVEISGHPAASHQHLDDNQVDKPTTFAHSSASHHLKRNHENEDIASKTKKIASLPPETELFPASGVKSSLHGVAYQWKILMLMAKRCEQEGYAFRLATEMNAAEKFDDAVLLYTKPGDDKQYSIFLQAKHIEISSESTKKISAQDLLTEKDDRFSLQKYFLSYQKIKEHKLGQNGKFVIYTNIDFVAEDFKHKLLQYFELVTEKDNLFNFGNDKNCNGKFVRLSSCPDVISELKCLFESTSEFSKLANILAQQLISGESIKLEGMFREYHYVLARNVIDLKSKKLKTCFITDMSPEVSGFRETLRESIEKGLENLKKKFPAKRSEREKKLLDTLGTDVSPKIYKLANQSADSFWSNVSQFQFVLSEGFQKIFIPQEDSKLNNLKSLTKEFVELITNNKNPDKSIRITQGEKKGNKIINSELSKLAGHVLVKGDGNRGIIFSENFLNGSSEFANSLKAAFNCKDNQELKNKLASYSFNIANFETCKEKEFENLIKTRPQFPKQQVTDQEIINFLSDLIFAVNQPNEMQLGEIISEELGAAFNLIDADLITNDFQNKILDWLKEKTGSYLSENKINAFFKEMGEKISQIVLMGPTAEYTQKLQEYGVAFDDKDFHEKLEIFLSSDDLSVLNLIVEPKLTLLGSIKVNQELIAKRRGGHIFIRLSSLIRLEDEVLRAFKKHENELLIIECKNKPTETFAREFCHKLIALFRITKGRKVIFISTRDNPLSNKFKSLNEYQEIFDETKFCQLDDSSQSKILEKVGMFQGKQVPLKQLMTSNSAIMNTLSLADLLQEKPLEISEPLAIPSSYDEAYYICRSFRQNMDSTKAPMNLDDLLLQAKQQKVIIISDTAGMGKSTLLTHLTHVIKQKNHVHWLVRIDLIDHVDSLAIQAKEKTENIQFLSEKILKLKTPLDKAFFNHSLEEGKVILMFDGFDEICPDHKKTVIELLRSIKGTLVEQLWITTRPHLRIELEQNLNQPEKSSYSLDPFSVDDQVEFLTKFWRKKLNLQENDQNRLECYSNSLIKKLAESINDERKNFTGNPLQTLMLAESFKLEVMENLKMENDTLELPERLRILDLYEKFIEETYRIHQEEKLKKNSNNPGIKEEKPILLKDFRMVHQQLAIEFIFGKSQAEELSISATFSNKELRIGIIENEASNPQFIHRIFSEYFVANFLIEELNKKEQMEAIQNFLLNNIFLKPENQVIRYFIDEFLKEFEPPIKIYETYGQRIETLWRKNQLTIISGDDDSILHIAAKENNSYIISFVQSGLDKKDYEDTSKELLMYIYSEKTAWEAASENGNAMALEALFRWAEKIFIGIEIKNALFLNKERHNVWSLAACNGHIIILEKMRQWAKSCGVSQEDINNQTLSDEKLLLSVLRGKLLDVLKILRAWLNEAPVTEAKIQNGFLEENIDANFWNETAWHYALTCSDIQTLEVLWGLTTDNLKKKLVTVDFNEKQRNIVPVVKKKPWHLLAETGSVEVFAKILEWGAEHGLENFIDDVTLSTTCYESDWSGRWHSNTVVINRPNMSYEDHQNLVERRHKKSTKYKRTALHIAALYGHKGILIRLLELTEREKLKDLLQKQDNHQKTALHLAMENEHWDVAKTLLKYGADIEEISDEQRIFLALNMSQE